jgi:predicted dehydrogenase
MHSKNFSAYAEPDDKATFYADGKTAGEELPSVQAAGSSAEAHTIGFFAEDRHFIDCIKSGTQPQTHFADAVKSMELVDRIYHSRM